MSPSSEECAADQSDALLRIRDLTVGPSSGGRAKAILDCVSVDIGVQEAVALVGESGSGKTMTALAILQLLPYGLSAEGSITLRDQELVGLSEAALSRIRGNAIAMIYQDPWSSFNPAFTVGEQIAETVRRHRGSNRREARNRAVELLDLVRIPEARRRVDDYPHMFSGGMLQRAGIAMALCCEPDLLLADEPTTALDATIQAQILELLDSLRRELGMALLLLSHDLSVVGSVCDRVVVMYAGQVVESGQAEDLFDAPMHPYSDGLVRSVVTMDRDNDLFWIPGVVPPPGARPAGCRFHPRCAHYKEGLCDTTVPTLDPHEDRLVRCLRVDELAVEGGRGHASKS